MDEARLQLDCQSEQITEATQRIKALEEHKNALLHKTTALETLANDRHTLVGLFWFLVGLFCALETLANDRHTFHPPPDVLGTKKVTKQIHKTSALRPSVTTD
jgi:hypothetical protein